MLNYTDLIIVNISNVTVECFNPQQESVQKLLVRRLYYTDVVL